MTTTPRWIIRTSVALAIALAGASTTLIAADPADEAAQVALQAVGKRLGVSPDTLAVAAVGTAVYPYLDLSVQSYKIADSKGQLHAIAVDAKLNPVDPQVVAASDHEQRLRKFGALDPALAERIGEGGKEPIAVAIWVRDTTKRRWDRPQAHGDSLPPEQIDQIYAGVIKARAAALKPVVTPVLERVREYDSEAIADGLAPVIGAKLTSEALQKLAHDSGIDTIYLDLPSRPELDIAKATTGINTIHNSGILGRGVRVADVEAFAGPVESNSLYLRPVVQDFAHLCGPQSDPHATAVAGVLLERRLNWGGSSPGEEGTAPAVELRSGGACTSDAIPMQDATWRSLRWGARVVNLSWGHDTSSNLRGLDRFYDEVVLNQWRTVVKSAGNTTPGAGCRDLPQDGTITSPGLAYNVITVGGFDDRNTPAWSDDTVYECSSFLNPRSTHNDREKPDLAAPAVNINVVAPGPAKLQDVTGTSIAAPMVVGASALLIEKNGMLSVWPEIIRAALMATADHNIEGATRLSDIDGAGGMNAAAAVDLIAQQNRWNGLRYDCAGPFSVDLATLSAGANTQHRVVLSWDSDPAFSRYGSAPSADIDLQIRDANGNLIATSMRWDATNEIVEFDTRHPGTFTLQAVRFRCDLPTWLGWAWHAVPIPGT
jgi:hypothetical protein